MQRREFLKVSSVVTLSGLASNASAHEMPVLDTALKNKLSNVKALTFDVFGTTNDWRKSIIDEGRLMNATRNMNVNWTDLADQWFEGYGPVVDRMRNGEIPWGKIDEVNKLALLELLPKFGLDSLNDAEIDDLNRAWHRIKPWPDVLEGLQELKRNYIISSLSDGNVSMLINIAKNTGMPWDCVLSSELSGQHYKPEKEVYLKTANLLGLEPHEILMVSCHKGDLAGATRAGLTTVLVPRPLAYKEGASLYDNIEEFKFDLMAADFIHLSKILRSL
jgi:2-haloacid dehalogenase